jgi:hypothetical protein
MARKQGNGRATGTKRSSGRYYYAQGQKIPVSRCDGLIAVQYHSRAPEDTYAAVESSRSDVLEPADEFKEMQEGSPVRVYRVRDSRSEAKARSLAQDVRAEETVENAGPVYTNDHGQPLVMTDELVVRFSDTATSDRIESLKAEHGLETISELGFSPSSFVLRVTNPGKTDPLQVANTLVENGDAEWAYPNWIEHVGYRTTAVEPEVRHGVHPTDPEFANQWHHENTGQVAGGVAGTAGADISSPLAWQTTMGDANIRLAVVDGGTDIAHNDLNAPGKSVDPIDFSVTPPDTNPVGGTHGTQVAGMAVATANNGVVGAGSAPNCRLIAIRAGDTIAQLQMARGFEHAADHGADVITCSLGPVGAWTMTDALRAAIDYATTYGRGGRGCVYTQAVDNQPNQINVDQVSAYERSIAVSRTNNRDTYDGAATGPELDVCAPGADVLTITNTAPGNAATQATVTGTSFATPLTAGVACLVLSVNPALSWEEVRQVLLDSADKIDTANAAYTAAPANRPPGTRNDRCGYGRVNAAAAVTRAQAGSTRDLFVRDTTSDTGTVPQPAWGFWDSPDIWVRNADDGGTVHQNTERGQDNFLHCRVSNRGSEASHPCWVRFYITTFAGTQFRYPFDYKQDTSGTHVAGHVHTGNLRPAGQFPTPATYLIGVQRIQSVPAGGSVIAKVPWPAALIPPAANWHPCLLVEVSPHDGPAATGQQVWENNNLAQKNITIVDGVRGQRIELPFFFGHELNKVKLLQLDVRPFKAPRDWQLYLAPHDPKIIDAIAGLAGLPGIEGLGNGHVVRPPGTLGTIVERPPEIEKTPFVRPLGFEPLGLLGHSPLKLTFLDPAKVALSSGALGREDDDVLYFEFPRGSSVELGRGRMDELVGDADDSLEDGEWRAARPAFELAEVDGSPMLALTQGLESAKVRVPHFTDGRIPSSLVVDVPKSAIPGETYVFDVAERTAGGELVGGARLEVRVVD